MTCARCHGLMVEQDCLEREAWQVSRRWAMSYRMWSCLNCGNCFDRTIAFNRLEQREAMTCQRHEQIWEEIVKQLEASAA